MIRKLMLSLGVGLLASPLASQAAPSELFFSEYIEGSSNNKALEIFNGTGGAINLGTGATSSSCHSTAARQP